MECSVGLLKAFVISLSATVQNVKVLNNRQANPLDTSSLN
ncbi:hypothetical protein MC7420_2555 [Coleofasciculus chthonoplastes PCC 7420]|uniref:Uncharacterized protein n=1 Tax=Coleofasciculus chthonoplastes PCC 7420 TaxID=118168 RepID=B4VYI0_9CYAN|nr:hypothetical protein MC7420_2555 [Coleofasciculus chthonoplastes PCC 7420]